MSGTSSKEIEILHVDDEPDFADLTATFLERENDRLAVETATNVDEGLERITDHPPDCIISDYDMPGMDGIEFLETVRDGYPKVPFILLTGKGSEEVARDALKAGATDYIQKQSGSEQYELLANRIENAVKQYRSIQELHEMQKEYAAVFENAQNALILVQVEDDGFRYRQCNPEAVELIGRDKDEIVGSTPYEALGPENGTKVVDAYRTCIERREPVGYTVTLDLPVGEVIRECEVAPVSPDGEIEQLVVEFRDITEKKERQQKLEKTSLKLETLVEAFPDVAFIMDIQGNYLEAFASPETEPLLYGGPKAYEDGQHITDVFDDDEADRILSTIQCAVDTGTIQSLEYQLNVPSGTRWFEGRIAPVDATIRDREVVVWVARDITEYKQREQQLQRQNERLEEFASVVSHDLRNPLRVANGQLELLREECESAHTDRVAQALDRMDALIDDVLTLAREGKQVEELEAIDLVDAIEDCWWTVENSEATLVTETEQTIHAEPSRLKQLLENLLRNAVEHGGKTVTITIGDLVDGQGFYIADDGPGIPESERDVVFDAGYSTAETGTGFGLSIVQEIAEAYGWDIDVTDSETGGARFEITSIDSDCCNDLPF